jgi:hypothetical protein
VSLGIAAGVGWSTIDGYEVDDGEELELDSERTSELRYV